MKTIFLSIVVSVLFFFSATASATCVYGCSDMGGNTGESAFGVVGFGEFNSNVQSDSEGWGYGDFTKTETFAKVEENMKLRTDTTGTIFAPNSDCTADCANNQAVVGFEGFVSSHSGAFNQSMTEGGPAGSTAVTSSHGIFDAGVGAFWQNYQP
ncbi:MAG: hypothetical protein R3B60_00305 [Candidatus Paceibacterota bacterium]